MTAATNHDLLVAAAKRTLQALVDILPAASPKGDPWVLSHKKNGITVKSRATDFSPALQWMGEGEIEASAEKVFAILTDAESR
ncbi:hypothetical protein HDU67_009754 [Dinochytrium kinnereticum]|nr:hypothetical protein HDU67_009754 [Dinochytrium kinnereticum]